MGVSRELFWRSTPRELREEFLAATARRKQDFDMLISTAWHAEFFARQKHLKGLATYLNKATPEEEEYMAEQSLVEEMSLGMTSPDERS